MQYVALRSCYSIHARGKRPEHIVAVVSRDALLRAIRYSKLASEVLDMLPEDMEEINAYLDEVLIIDTSERIPNTELQLDLLVALTTLHVHSWIELDESEYAALQKLRASYPFSSAELRASFYNSQEHPAFLYVECEDYSQYWFDENVQMSLLKEIQAEMKPEVSDTKIPQDVLEYPVEISKLADGYLACVPYLGRWTFQADGSTVQEALSNLQEVYTAVSRLILEHGGEILPPPGEDRSW